MNLLGIHGLKGSGKTTLAGRLVLSGEFGRSARVALAEPLKQIAVDVLGLDPAAVQGDDRAKDAATSYRLADMPFWCKRCASADDVGDGNRTLTVREMLQLLGTEVFRRIDPAVWVKALFRRLDRFHRSLDLAVVDDVRFADEAAAIRNRGGKVVSLARGRRTSPHSSEAGLDKFVPDLVVPAGLDARETYVLVYDQLTRWGWRRI